MFGILIIVYILLTLSRTVSIFTII
jgi:ATP-binding cassette, subfamily C (CFTR/MRP), member 4